jgi:Na+-translocating ferredoxin:NAD+ oxidoreductase RnfA subunit
MKIISDLLITALYTVFVQNLVLSSGLGMSEAIRVSTKPGMFGKFAAMISGFSVVTSVLCSLIDKIPFMSDVTYAIRSAVYGGILAAVFIVVVVAARFIFRASDEFLGTLGIAALNTLVFAIPHINNSAAYSFSGSIGSGIGAGIAFVLAAALISKGSQKLAENEDIPEVFKGTPAMFFYVALLSLAFAGFTDSNII